MCQSCPEVVQRAVYLFLAVREVEDDASVVCAADAPDRRDVQAFFDQLVYDTFAGCGGDVADHVVGCDLRCHLVNLLVYFRHEFVESHHVADGLPGRSAALECGSADRSGCAEDVAVR